MSGKVTLIEYKRNLTEGSLSRTWVVSHTTTQLRGYISTLEQNVTLNTDFYCKHTPIVALDDFPQGLSEREAMLKLSDCLHRLAVSIEDHWGLYETYPSS